MPTVGELEKIWLAFFNSLELNDFLSLEKQSRNYLDKFLIRI